MANDISGSVWRIDTVPFSYTGMVKITNLNITDATAADHVQVFNTNGKTLVDFTANASELDYRVGWLGWANGIKLNTGNLGTTAVVTIAVGAGK